MTVGPLSGWSEAAAQMIRNSEGRSSIAAVARYAAMSQSALERHFRAAVGPTPKGLSRLARLQHICRLWDRGKILRRSLLKPVTAINHIWCAISGSSLVHLRRSSCEVPVAICRLFTSSSHSRFLQSCECRGRIAKPFWNPWELL
jgi:AraC-like DNA-binding protein